MTYNRIVWSRENHDVAEFGDLQRPCHQRAWDNEEPSRETVQERVSRSVGRPVVTVTSRESSATWFRGAKTNFGKSGGWNGGCGKVSPKFVEMLRNKVLIVICPFAHKTCSEKT